MMKALTSVVSVVLCMTVLTATAPVFAAEAAEPAPATRSSPAVTGTVGPGRIEEIVVTGEFRSSSLQETPASISVVSLENSRAGTVNHLEEILGWLPNVNFASGGSRARFFQVRGIGERVRIDGRELVGLADRLDAVGGRLETTGAGVSAAIPLA